MAEAAHFFCHNCKQEINALKQDFTCPRCSTGFVEELGSGPTQQNERLTGSQADDSDSRPPERRDSALAFNQLWMQLAPEAPGAASHAAGPRHPQVRIRHIGRDADPAQNMIMILQHLLGLGGVANHPFPVQLMNLHGRPGDYAWGERGLDTIITQLLSNLEGGGPPPAEKTDIDNIPKSKVTKDIVDEHVECAVCKEEYEEDEDVRTMPCGHLFHPECIVPWLEMHNTCPVCRKSLDGRYTRNDFSADEDSPPEDTEDRNSQSNSASNTGHTIINQF